MASSRVRRELTQVALDYAAIAAIGLGVLMVFVGYPRRGAELLIAGMGLLVFKHLVRRLSGPRSTPQVEVYRNVVLIKSDGQELPSKLVDLTREGGFTLGEAGEQLRIGESIQIRINHFEAHGIISRLDGAWAGGRLTEVEHLLQPAEISLDPV
jgi:D-serine deaminase-like pyridoxal phosphate-dependent protein